MISVCNKTILPLIIYIHVSKLSICLLLPSLERPGSETQDYLFYDLKTMQAQISVCIQVTVIHLNDNS